MKPARRALDSVRNQHYRPTAPLFPHWPEPLKDLPAAEIQRANQSSDQYFGNQAQEKFWLNKPLSDLDHGAQSLWRFGLLIDALGIRPEDRVLDFGCGTGWTSILLARTGAEITGTDISAQAIAIAQKSAESSLSNEHRIRFQVFDGQHIDAPDQYFDFVVVMDAFHHLPNSFTVLEEFHRILNQHGCFGFAEPGIGHSETHTAHDESEHGVIESEVDPEQLRTTARQIGFDEMDLLIPPLPPNMFTLTMPRARWFLRGLPWIVPQNFIRASMLASPIGVVRKGPYPSTSLHPHTLEAEIRARQISVRAKPGEPIKVEASVVNRTGTTWLKHGRRGSGYVRFGAHLLNSERKILEKDYGRAELPRDLQQNEKTNFILELTAPNKPGVYIIQLDMVDEGILWFAEKTSKAADVELIVDQDSGKA